MILLILLTLKKDKIENINSQEKTEKNSPLLFRMISLGGIPPTVGFFPKIIVIFLIIKTSKKTLILIPFILLSTVIRIISYLRLLTKTMIKRKKKSKFKRIKNNLFFHKAQLLFFPTIIIIFPL